MTPDEAEEILQRPPDPLSAGAVRRHSRCSQGKGGAGRTLDMVLTGGAGFAGFAVWGLGLGPQGPDYMACR